MALEMRNISEASSIALHTMAYLASNPGRKVPSREIAEAFRISEAHLAKVLQRLSRAGLVRSTRGPLGGSVLDGDPGDIKLIRIIEAVDGPISFSECLFHRKPCPGADCVMGGTLKKVNGIFRDYFTKTPLSGFAKKFRSGT